MRLPLLLVIIGVACAPTARFVGAPSQCHPDELAPPTGTITGVVCTTAGDPIEGVTAVVLRVTAGALHETTSQSVTDRAGRYVVKGLEPGDYTVQFYFRDLVIEVGHVLLGDHAGVAIDRRLETERPRGEESKRDLLRAGTAQLRAT